MKYLWKTKQHRKEGKFAYSCSFFELHSISQVYFFENVIRFLLLFWEPQWGSEMYVQNLGEMRCMLLGFCWKMFFSSFYFHRKTARGEQLHHQRETRRARESEQEWFIETHAKLMSETPLTDDGYVSAQLRRAA